MRAWRRGLDQADRTGSPSCLVADSSSHAHPSAGDALVPEARGRDRSQGDGSPCHPERSAGKHALAG